MTERSRARAAELYAEVRVLVSCTDAGFNGFTPDSETLIRWLCARLAEQEDRIRVLESAMPRAVR